MAASAATSTAPQFQLSAELQGHTADIRAVCLLNGLPVTASRDRSVRVWTPAPEGGGWEVHRTLLAHEHWVGAVAALPAGAGFGGQLASGGNDNVIMVWDVEAGLPVQQLRGHQGPVSSLAASLDGRLVSGSLDNTARVWKGEQCVATLTGHTLPVWSVLMLPNGDIVTASADKTIRLWRDNACIKTLTGHTDCVRSLSLAEFGFFSTSNDGTIRMWSFDGMPMDNQPASDTLIYFVHFSGATGEILSGGEDRSLKVWKSGELQQAIALPAVLWSAIFLPNGDLLSATSDGVARVWSRDPARVAAPEVLATYQANVAGANSGGGNRVAGNVGDLDIARLPGPEAIEQPGRRDGESKMIRVDGAPVLYSWSATTGSWERIGDIVDARDPAGGGGGGGASGANTIDGKRYDYVWDVDLGDGPNRKLGYNNGENPYMAAQNFIWKEEISQEYLYQIATFIQRNASTVVIGPPDSSAPALPGYQGYAADAAPPPTGASVPPPAVPGAAAVAAAATPMQGVTATFVHFPMSGMVYFDKSNFAGMQKKLQELNAQLAEAPGTKAAALSDDDDEPARLVAILAVLEQTMRYHATTFSARELQLVVKLLRWPIESLLPVLDLVRALLMHPEAAANLPPAVRLALGVSLPDKLIGVAANAATPAVTQMLCLRALCNMFRWPAARTVLSQHADRVLEALADLAKSANGGVRETTASLLINFSVDLKQIAGGDRKAQCVSLTLELLSIQDRDPEAIYRALVALGSLVLGDTEAKETANALDAKAVVARLKSHSVAKIAQCADEVLRAL